MKAMLLCVAAVIVAAASVSVEAQGSAAPKKDYVPARLSDGQPDIQGYWTERKGGPEAVNVETGMQTADSLP